jgi:hypothetical protein
MNKLFVFVCCLVLLAGCARRSLPVNKPQAAPRPTAANSPIVGTGTDAPPDRPIGMAHPASVAAVSQQKVEQWVEQLSSKNTTNVTEAAAALGALGERGYPYLFKGLQSSSDDLRLTSIQSMHVKELVGHQRDTLPVLAEMLRDPNPALRGSAVGRLGWYGKDAAKYMQFVQSMAQNDPDDNVRLTAAVAVNALFEAMSGKTITGAPNDPTIPK